MINAILEWARQHSDYHLSVQANNQIRAMDFEIRKLNAVSAKTVTLDLFENCKITEDELVVVVLDELKESVDNFIQGSYTR